MKTESNSTTETNHSKLMEFFVNQLRDIYWAEKKLVRTLPILEDAATTPELKKAFADHLEETRNHVERLREVFGLIDEAVVAQKCPAMAGIVNEGEDIIEETEWGSSQRDVGIIFAGQKAEHYEIATYGGLVSLARTLECNEAATILEKTLAEEKAADMKLTMIAESNVNYKASKEPAEA